MLRLAKSCTKRLFRAVGVDIRRVPPFQPYGWLADEGICTVLDVGANVGQFASQIHKTLPQAKIYSFEPLSGCYAQLLCNMKQASGFQAFNHALGDSNGRSQIYRNDFSASSSLLPMEELHKRAFPFTANAKQEMIEIRRLDDVAPQLEMVDNILVKIDVQGTEDKVIQGGAGVLARASILIVETSFKPLYQGQPLFATIYDLLRGMDFVYMGTEDIMRDPRNGRVLQCDSLFMSRSMQVLA
jgi:FkbM family methyltransferase